ncbi:hypothetical protein EMIT0162MI3_50046 [Pseudomonas chlororaphis]
MHLLQRFVVFDNSPVLLLEMFSSVVAIKGPRAFFHHSQLGINNLYIGCFCSCGGTNAKGVVGKYIFNKSLLISVLCFLFAKFQGA